MTDKTVWDVDCSYRDEVGLEAEMLDEVIEEIKAFAALGEGDHLVARRRVRLGLAVLTVTADGFSVTAEPPEGTTWVEDAEQDMIEPWELIAGRGHATVGSLADTVREETLEIGELPTELPIAYWRQDEPVAVRFRLATEPVDWKAALAEVSAGYGDAIEEAATPAAAE